MDQIAPFPATVRLSHQIAVERAIAEMRAGRPVLVQGQRASIMVQCVEGLDAAQADLLQALLAPASSIAPQTIFGRLLLQGPRLRHLGYQTGRNGALALPTLDLSRIETLSFALGARLDAPVAPLSQLDEAALELARLALVLPALVVVPATARRAGKQVLKVAAQAIFAERAAAVENLHIVGRAPVPLEGAPQTEFVIFRGGEGLRDQVAIIVGQPSLAKPVSVRLHSACLTGDLFGSLKCDCGDQLRTTVRHMAETGGGILLYLDQEGRGNGLSNKIRAYRLQAQGFDTYDADAILGFEHDQRRFDFAAKMLLELGVKRVDLLTNNPEKIAALQQAGLEVASHRRVLGRATDYNLHYLATKRDRAGHFIDAELKASPVRAAD